ncbi:MAG: LptF/LptG family permease, partial [Hyphomicrobiales bacterium]
MSRIERYIFAQAATAFLASLLAMTMLVWLTQGVREFDLMTSRGQTIIIFFIITSLVLPTIIVIIAPFALSLASIWTLNRLNSDSELVVMNAAGMSSVRVARPFLLLAVLASVAVGAVTLYGQPAALRELRYWVTQVRADLIAQIVREG